MAKFQLRASKCSFENGYFGFILTDFGGLGQKDIEASSCDQLAQALADYSAEIGAAYAGSYFVSQLLKRGERAPKGYRAWAKSPASSIQINQKEQAA
jgi:hypothetical protein